MMAGKPKVKKKMSDYNRFIKKELKGKTGPGYKSRFRAAVAKWKRSPKGRASKAGKPPRRQRRPSGGPPRTRARPRTTRARPKSTGGRKMAGFNSQKIMKYIRLAALAAPAITAAMAPTDAKGKVNAAIASYTGYNLHSGTFNAADLAKGWTPYLASVVATYGIPKLAGIIRGL